MALLLKCHVRTEETDVRLFLEASDPIIAVPEMPLQKGWRHSGLSAVSPWQCPGLVGPFHNCLSSPGSAGCPWPASGAVWLLQAKWLLWPSRWSDSRGWTNKKGRLCGPALTLLKPLTLAIQTPILLLGLSQTWRLLLKTTGCLVADA